MDSGINRVITITSGDDIASIAGVDEVLCSGSRVCGRESGDAAIIFECDMAIVTHYFVTADFIGGRWIVCIVGVDRVGSKTAKGYVRSLVGVDVVTGT